VVPQFRRFKAFLQKHVTDFGKEFYVCGPPSMVKHVSQALEELGAQSNNITFEE
jgi:ferredoxin-NADP reductase